MTRSRDKGVGNAPANDQLVNLFRKRFQNSEFARDLGSTDDGNQRPGRILQRLAQRL